MDKESKCSGSIRQGDFDGDIERQLRSTVEGGEDDSPQYQEGEISGEKDAGVLAGHNGTDRTSNGLMRVLSKVVSRASTTANPGPPPDGGSKAWITGELLLRDCIAYQANSSRQSSVPTSS